MATVRVIKELKVSPERAVVALRRWAYEAINDYPENQDLQSCFVQTHNTMDLRQPLSETEVEKILEDARDNPELSSVGKLTSDAKSLGIHLEVPQALHQAMRIVEQAGPDTLESLLKPKTADRDKAVEQEANAQNWRDHFRSVNQLEDGGIRFLIDGLFPEGTTFIGALPGAGKTWLGLSIAKALCTGKKFLGRFNVPQRIPVLYLIPEVSSRAFKKRIKQLDIPTDPNYFLCRTISEGNTLMLDNPIVLEAVKAMKPVIMLDTAIRFSTSTDENAASQNRKLVDDIVALRAAGAVGVFAFHHATKSSSKEAMTQENTLRGTGDYAAMCDAAYGIQVNQSLYDNGRGPLEILVVCTKPRDISPQPKPFTLISTLVGDEGQLVDVLAREKDFLIKDEGDTVGEIKAAITKIVMKEPEIDVREIAEILTKDYGFKTSKSAVNRQMHNDDYKKEGPVGPNGKKTWMCGTIQLLNLLNKSGPEKQEATEVLQKNQEELSF